MTDELKQWEYDRGYEKGKKDGTIEELENIKIVLEKLSNEKWNQEVGASKGLEMAVDVLDIRIYELKAKNNG